MANWAARHLGCFATGIDKGLRHGRIDVLGLRDTGGRLSGRSEVVSIEVKRGSQPYATSIGQASGYSIYADRCYLAEYRPSGFTGDEVSIATTLGVGLIQISGSQRVRLREVLTAPIRHPLAGLRLEVIEKLNFSECTICGALFARGAGTSSFSRVKRQDGLSRHVRRAVEDEKGFVYWLHEQADRTGDRSTLVYHRRYVCPDCALGLFGHLVED